MSHFTRTETILDQILARKVEEVAALLKSRSLDSLRAEAEVAEPVRDFVAALIRPQVALIAEVKKASPSKGVLLPDFDPVALAQTYAEHGAAAISVLTDVDFFQGQLDDLRLVRAAVTLPVLRKDFIVDEAQLYEARAAGADAVLLIVAALDDAQLRDFQALAHSFQMAALVEVHTAHEMERAVEVDARLIGINNRDLKTFQVSLEVTRRLAPLAPHDVVLVAESGISSGEDVAHMGAHGAQAVLVGESLVKAGSSLAERVREFSQQERPA